MYCLPSTAIPSYLQGRPPSVVKHCLARKTKSNKFTEEAVKDSGTHGVFHHKDAGKHVVNFGCTDGMPTCTCKDWMRWHIPCKHFLPCFDGGPIGSGILFHCSTEPVLTYQLNVP